MEDHRGALPLGGPRRCCAWLLVGLVALLAAGSAATAFADEEASLQVRGIFGPDGTSESNFNRAGAVAVDQSTETVYVIDQEGKKLYKFGEDGQPVQFSGSAPYIDGNAITGLEFLKGLWGVSQVAVDGQRQTIYVAKGEGAVQAFDTDGEPALFSDGPGAGTNKLAGAPDATGVAIDSSGDIYVATSEKVISVFAPDGAPITTIDNGGRPISLAVDAAGDVYAGSRSFPTKGYAEVVKYEPSSFPVTAATVYAEGPSLRWPGARQALFSTAVAISPATGLIYVVWEGASVSDFKVASYDAAGNLLGTFAGQGEEGEVPKSQGVGVGTVEGDEVVFVSFFDGLASASKVESFGPPPPEPGPPSISSTAVKDVSGTSASFTARINPNTVATDYHFEAGVSDCASIPDPCAAVSPGGELAAGHKPVSVSGHVSGLLPGTVYHYRLVAENEFGASTGEDLTFKTQSAGGPFELADGRGWELVSPAAKIGGGVIIPPERGAAQASGDGDALSFVSRGFIEAGPEGNRTPDISQSLARHGSSGWSSAEIVPPHDNASTLSNESEYLLFSPDLARATLEPHGSGPLSAEASERTPYLRENFTVPVRWRPIVTGKEGYANVPPGTEFGGSPFQSFAEVTFAGASQDLGHVVIASSVPLAEEADGVSGEVLYEWFEGKLSIVSRLPSGKVAAATLGSSLSASTAGSVTHAVSDDGRFVFFSGPGLFVRDMQEGETIRLDVPKSGASGDGGVSPFFQGASADGKRVFFTDTQRLTPDASATGADLYECDLVRPNKTKCVLRDITATSGGSADVQGLAPAINESGDVVYFVANGALAPGGEDGSCTLNGAGKTSQLCNLYVSLLKGEVWETRLVARLANSDKPDWGLPPSLSKQQEASTQFMAAASSPSGRYLTFMSSRELTGYDNHDAASGVPDVEVYRYDTAADALTCVSCNPTQGQPRGIQAQGRIADGSFPQGPIDWGELWNGHWVAATSMERNAPSRSVPALYHPRAALDNGRVFFNAVDSLVTADVNGVADAYEYEPFGLGTCSPSSDGPATAVVEAGCVSMLSSGTSNRAVGILDASTTGNDVFLLTPGKLSPTDTDTAYDVYDAHVCGSSWQCPAPPAPAPAECTSAGSCRSAPVTGEEPTAPGSSTFSGEGKVHRAKHKHKKHRRKHRGGKAKKQQHRRGGANRGGGK